MARGDGRRADRADGERFDQLPGQAVRRAERFDERPSVRAKRSGGGEGLAGADRPDGRGHGMSLMDEIAYGRRQNQHHTFLAGQLKVQPKHIGMQRVGAAVAGYLALLARTAPRQSITVEIYHPKMFHKTNLKIKYKLRLFDFLDARNWMKK